MSSSRNSLSENQASASENESDRHALVTKQQRAVSSHNKPLQTVDDSHSPSNKKYAIPLTVALIEFSVLISILQHFLLLFALYLKYLIDQSYFAINFINS